MFKAGDRVRCVDTDNMSFPLNKQKIFTVQATVSDRIELENGKLYFQSRFVLVS